MSQELKQTFRAFVLMPFDIEFDKIFSDLIKPALEEVGYEVKRADNILDQQNILKDIMRGIAETDLIIADLTSLNANVFYELGISHTMQKCTILLAQSEEDVPFDLRSYRVVYYSTHFSDAPKLSQVLKDIGEKAKSGNLRFGNPVTDFLPQNKQVELSILNKSKESIEVETEKEAEPEEEKGLWDFVVDGEKSLKDITECTKRITETTQEIGSKMRQHTDEVNKIAQSGVPGTASRVHKIATKAASDIIKYAKELEEEQPKFHNAWESFAENTTGLLQTTRIHDEKDKEVIHKFRSQVDNLQSAVKRALTGMKPFRESIANLKGISREVNRASGRTTRILDLLISDLEGAESYCTKILTLLDEKIKQEV